SFQLWRECLLELRRAPTNQLRNLSFSCRLRQVGTAELRQSARIGEQLEQDASGVLQPTGHPLERLLGRLKLRRRQPDPRQCRSKCPQLAQRRLVRMGAPYRGANLVA